MTGNKIPKLAGNNGIRVGEPLGLVENEGRTIKSFIVKCSHQTV